MIEFLSSLVILFSVLILTIVEKRHLNSLLTPFTVTAWPFAIISLIVNTVAVRMGFLPVSSRANFFILLNLIIIWIIGFLLFRTQKPKLINKNFAELFLKFKEFKLFLLVLSWIVIIGVGAKIFSIVSSEGWQFIGDDRFEQKMIVGFSAHLAQLGKVLLILLLLVLWNTKKNLFEYLTMTLLVIVIMSLMVKYHIVWVVLIVFFIVNMGLQPLIQFKKISYITLMVVVVFIINYLILFLSWQTLAISDERLWIYIFGWLTNYLMSGPILLDQWMDKAFSQPWWALFIVPINFYNVIMGNPERISAVKFVSPGFSNVSPDFSSNVGTSFGVYYLIGGFLFTILMTIFIALISYYLYFKLFNSGNPVLSFFTALFLTMGTLAFFVQYFTLLSLYEISVYFLILTGILQFLYKIKYKNN